MITQTVVLLGAVLILLAGVGVVRFDDVLARMHALTKASTLGLLLVLIGAAFHLQDPNDITSLALAAGLQILTSPVSAHLIGRATYRSAPFEHRMDVVDQLAEREDRSPAAGRGRPPIGPGRPTGAYPEGQPPITPPSQRS